MTLAAGDKLGPYQIISPLGSGGMGEVYRARDPRLGRDVAIKVAADQFSERFSREAHAVAALNHPNICTLYDVGPNYLVMELVDGPTLDERIRKGAIPLDEALDITRQIAEALDAAHEKGVVHRDLKPGNIKIRHDGVVKVLDFGIAKIENKSASAEDFPTVSETGAGVILGTAAYMSPEQAKGKLVDKRTDIWALGVVVYEMLTGRRPFHGETGTEVLASVLKEEPQWERVPAEVVRLVRRCLEKDAQRRLRHAGDVMALVEDAPAKHGPAQPGKNTPWFWAVAAGVMALVAILAVWSPWRTPPTAAGPTRFQASLPENFGALTISPDGRKFAFFGLNTGSGMSLWVRDMDSAQWRTIASIPNIGVTSMFWSADSRSIGFVEGPKLKRVEAAGGVPETVCECIGGFGGASWSQDGVILLGSAKGVMQVSAGGGVPSPVTKTDPSRMETAHVGPSFLPDGRHFLYRRNASTADGGGLYVGSLDAKPEEQASHRVGPFPAAVYAPVTEGDGRLLFLRQGTLSSASFDVRRLEVKGEAAPLAEQVASFSVSQNGALVYRTAGGGRDMQLTWFDRQGKVLGTVGEPGRFQLITLSPDALRVAVSQYPPQNAELDVWLIDVKTGARTRFTFDPGQESNPTWFPDGSRVVYVRADPPGIYQKPSNNAGGAEELFKSNLGRPDVSQFSVDGRFLLFSPLSLQGQDLWVLPLTGDRKPIPFLRTPSAEFGGRFSPDGHWIAYISNVSGSNEIYVRPFDPSSPQESSPTSTQWMISKGAVGMPRWRGDGKEFFYLAPDGGVMSVEVSTSPVFKAGTPAPLFHLSRVFLNSSPVGTPGSLADVTTDGKRFLIAMPVAESAPEEFTVVLNWPGSLKR